ncbi:hypothetical protein AVEN_115743-1 [Araneus ventricosus]|uniref:Uncharacterized protein n=1 Tax=Araneus ventricosus TaxID=182803 RepID=A0A4Y2LL06_ARAVE|nr:hypothetical protein AVEN_115743-1 [Araneus ventricosus]
MHNIVVERHGCALLFSFFLHVPFQCSNYTRPLEIAKDRSLDHSIDLKVKCFGMYPQLGTHKCLGWLGAQYGPVPRGGLICAPIEANAKAESYSRIRCR